MERGKASGALSEPSVDLAGVACTAMTRRADTSSALRRIRARRAAKRDARQPSGHAPQDVNEPDAVDTDAPASWDEKEAEALEAGVSGSVLFEAAMLDSDDDDDDDDAGGGDGAEDAPMFEDQIEYGGPQSIKTAEAATGDTVADERAEDGFGFASEVRRTRAVLLRLEQAVGRDLKNLVEQIEAINHRISALEQDHDAIRNAIDGAPDQGTPDLRALRAQVRALNHRITAIERAGK